MTVDAGYDIFSMRVPNRPLGYLGVEPRGFEKIGYRHASPQAHPCVFAFAVKVDSNQEVFASKLVVVREPDAGAVAEPESTTTAPTALGNTVGKPGGNKQAQTVAIKPVVIAADAMCEIVGPGPYELQRSP